MAIPVLMVTDRGDGRNYLGLQLPRLFRGSRERKCWMILEQREGWWVVASEHDYRPKVNEGQRLVRGTSK